MNYEVDFSTANSDQIAKAMGSRLEKIRLSRNITQRSLAEEAGVAVRTLRNLEKGEGVSLDTFLRVLGALGVQQNLETLLPDPKVRPMERIANKGRERKRASSMRVAEPKAWSWGDGDHEQ